MIFTSVAVAILLPLIYKVLVKKVALKDDYKIYFEINVKWLRVFSIIMFVITCVLTMLINIFVEIPFYINIILLFCVLYFTFFIVVARFNVLVNDGEIVYTPSFSKTKRFHMTNISLIKVKREQYGIEKYTIFVFDKKILNLSNMMKNVQEFINMARAYNIKFEYVEKVADKL